MAEKDRTNRREDREPERTRDEAIAVPDVDIYESDDRLVLIADMPGVGPDEVHVTVEEGELVIEGRAAPRATADATDVYREFRPVSFRRTFSISREIDTAKVEGSISNGVLTVKLPKAEEAQAKRIEITAE